MIRLFRPSLCRLTCGVSLVLGSVTALAHEPVAGSAVIKVSVDRAEVEPNLIPAEEEAEVVQERYDNRQLKIERHVARDGQGDYKNHGPWAMWDEQGDVIGFGAYRFGARQGKWVRFFIADEAEVLKSPNLRQFTAPFKSEANFDNGELDGEWMITDANRRVMFRFAYEHGVRHGTSTYFYPNGRKWKEVSYRNGDVDGTCQEWGPTGDLLEAVNYIGGRYIGTKANTYSDGSVKFQAQYLFAKEVVEATEDWWDGLSRRAVKGTEGEDVKHGPWTSWYKNGQKAMEGIYRNDVPSGKFVWYHPNGQKAIEGDYVEGKQTGRWQWFYPSGGKQIQGEYANGQQSNRWTWWTEEGDLADSANFNLGSTVAQTAAEQDDAEPLEVAPSEPKLERLPSATTAKATPSKPSTSKGPVRSARRR